MRFSRHVNSGVLFTLLWAFLAACDGATPQSPVQQQQQQKRPSVLGQWARSAEECKRPELILDKSSAMVQTDADGQAVAFTYDTVSYAVDGPSQISVELGKAHPYGKTASKTALTFKLVSADQIELVQANRLVAFQRCATQAR